VSTALGDLRPLLDRVRAVMRDVVRDAEATATLDRLAHRLDEPLIVAIAGKVKAGKSTLLNALIGESLAPTDAGECTQIVTWYRNGPTYKVTCSSCTTAAAARCASSATTAACTSTSAGCRSRR
jgi:ATPase subunit of ABC transporter with duplicated ATPase domains